MRHHHAVFLALLLCGSLTAQAIVLHEQALNQAGGASLDAFGHDVSIDDDLAVVTALGDGKPGSATVFEFDGTTWIEGQTLTASDAGASDRYGVACLILGDTILIGAEHDDDGVTNSGSVYVYEYDGAAWQEITKLHAADPAKGDAFGHAIDAFEDVLIVGAPGKDAGHRDAGAAYIFRKIGGAWLQDQKLRSPSPALLGGFGGAVSTSGIRSVVGAPREDLVGEDSGAAHVYLDLSTGWELQQTLTASDAAAGDLFGSAVSISTVRIGCGAYRHDDARGAVYAFKWDGAAFAEQQKLQPSTVKANDQFGFSVAVHGNRLVAGSPTSFGGEGSAIHFHNNATSWAEVHTWKASSPGSTGSFLPNMGFSVDMDIPAVMAGAPWADAASENSGSASWCDVTDLALSVKPFSPIPGEPALFVTFGGYDSEHISLFVNQVGGTPGNLLLYEGFFDVVGKHRKRVRIPASAAGLEVTMRALGQWTPGFLGSSNWLTLTIGS